MLMAGTKADAPTTATRISRGEPEEPMRASSRPKPTVERRIVADEANALRKQFTRARLPITKRLDELAAMRRGVKMADQFGSYVDEVLSGPFSADEAIEVAVRVARRIAMARVQQRTA